MSQSSTDGTSLYTALMTGYQKHVRPGTDYSVPLQVNVTFGLITIQAFNELEGKFAVTGFFTITWVDERLNWTPGSYSSMASTLLQQKEVWKPNMVLGNTYNNIKFLGLDDFYIRYLYTGLATWNPVDVFEVSCDADVTFYPFDSQSCKLLFTTWFYRPTEISFNVLNSELDLGMFTENSIWELMSTQMTIINSGFEIVEIKLFFKRRFLFYLVNMILPMCMMTAINSFVFILPVESGERIGFSITNLLSIAVFLTIVTDALPQSSMPQISVLSYLLLTQMGMSVLIMLLTILSVKVYLSEEEKVPQHYITFVNIMEYKCLKKKPQTATVTPTEIYVTPVSSDKTDEKSGSRRKSPGDQKKHPTVDETATEKPQTDGEVELTWKKVGHAFDKASMLFIIFASVCINMGFMVYLIHTYF
ncbi:Neuronal acetylcholine receptor subunit alpha-6 [Mizuhopecten yessoensis]|uniref:Neuronal acetylcholine receptor subunit alpha-6 n=2 Tax=Mizuhopecten yessoensis TaxID=6573 RepID=A0A210QNF9_MIZYE|nr:Neuronal acetylcholine receptor subunit alpha-6 [Mizuhopecten yessoensis]